MRRFLKSLLILICAILASAIFVDGSVSAVNLPNPTEITLSREITGVKHTVNNTFIYEIIEADGEDLMSNLPSGIEITFENAEPDEEDKVYSETTIDLSGINFKGAAGYRRLAIREVSSSDDFDFAVDTDEYYFYVMLQGEVDANNDLTGNYSISLIPQLEYSKDQKKYDVASFSNVGTHVRSYITITNDSVDKEAVYKYVIRFENSEPIEYFVSSDDTEYEYEGETFANPEACPPEGCVVYLKSGESITIGNPEEGPQIRPGTRFTIDQYGPDGYDTFINDSIDPATSAEGEAFVDAEQNVIVFKNVERKEEPAEEEKEDSPFVDTGIIINAVPFMILAAIAVSGMILVKKIPRK